MAASHTKDSLIAACNDCEIKYVGKYNIYICILYTYIQQKKHLETQDVETIIPEKDVVPEMESFCVESFRLNVASSEECVFLF